MNLYIYELKKNEKKMSVRRVPAMESSNYIYSLDPNGLFPNGLIYISVEEIGQVRKNATNDSFYLITKKEGSYEAEEAFKKYVMECLESYLGDFDSTIESYAENLKCLDGTGHIPEINTVLSLSISHLSENTCVMMEHLSQTKKDRTWPHITDTGYGFLIHYAKEDTEGIMLSDSVPADIKAIISYADSFGCRYLNVDRDADTVSGLATYKW